MKADASQNNSLKTDAELFSHLYDELKIIARSHMKGERADHTLQPTALINEAFVRLMSGKEVKWEDERHFLCVAASVMRRILVDAARSRDRLKRGREFKIVTLQDNVELEQETPLEEVLTIHEALKKLETKSPERCRLVELRFFGGLTIHEAADAMKISPTSAKKHWALSKAWLYRELNR